jgi:hypothetical protein
LYSLRTLKTLGKISPMKNYYPASLFLLVSVCLSSCVPDQKKEEKESKVSLTPVSINGEYSMSVPEFMSKASSLNDGASLQYQNLFKEAYVIVIDEPKADYVNAYKELSVYDTTRSVISNYTDTQIQSITANVEVLAKTEIKSFKVNGLKAKSLEVDGNLEGVNSAITYFLTCIEGKDKLYLVMAWTLQDRKDKHRETFKEMVKTFRTL